MIGLIEIDNFRSIKKSEIKLERINVLIGSNGSGKSNFLAFFKLVRTILDQDMINYFKRRGGFSNVKYKGSPKTENIEGIVEFDNTNAFFFEIESGNNDIGILKQDGDWWNGYHKKTTKISDIYEKEINHHNWHYQGHPNSPKPGSIIKDKLTDPNTSSREHVRYSAVYNQLIQINIFHFHDTSPQSPLRQQSSVNDNRKLKEDGENIASYLYKIQEKEPFNFKLIESTIASVFPNFLRFNLEALELNKGVIELSWSDSRFPDEYMNASHFSDGTLRFIALSTLLLQKRTPPIIIIDEPELGLHPFAIQKLAAMLRNAAEKGSQIVIATQSVDLLNYFNADEIMTVDYDKEQTIFKRLDPKDLTAWLGDYSLGDLWQKNIIGGQV